MLIAEIGNCHDGTIEDFKRTVRIAYECGADAAKGQAFNPRSIAGSMPYEFYKERAFTLEQYMELIDYGARIGIPVFFSIFSEQFSALKVRQTFQKFSGGQTISHWKQIEASDYPNVIVSIKEFAMLPRLKYSKILHVSKYLTDLPHLEQIEFLSEYYGRQVGYSDHTVGIFHVERAIKDYGAHVIEKHFTLTRDISHGGHQFRDAVHAADPQELEQIAKILRG